MAHARVHALVAAMRESKEEKDGPGSTAITPSSISDLSVSVKRFRELLLSPQRAEETESVLQSLQRDCWEFRETLDQNWQAKIDNIAQFNQVVRKVPLLARLSQSVRDRLAER